MYNFILNMWIMRRIDATKVQSYVPTFITQIQCDMIFATPQLEEPMTVSPETI